MCVRVVTVFGAVTRGDTCAGSLRSGVAIVGAVTAAGGVAVVTVVVVVGPVVVVVTGAATLGDATGATSEADATAGVCVTTVCVTVFGDEFHIPA